MALVAVGILGLLGWLLARRRRRARWDAGLASARTEARWVSAELVPAATAQPEEQWRGAWSVARPRARALDAQFAGLVDTAPDPERTASARALLSASAATTAALERLALAPDEEARLALESAAQRLAAAIEGPATAD